MPVDPGQLDAVLKQITKAYGDSAVRFASEKPPLQKIPTGSLQLDYATGGGIPIGRWAHFYGGFGSGKTLTTMKVIKNAQEMGLTCALYNVEKRFNKEWAKLMGVNIKELVLVEGTEIETVGAKMESLLTSVHLHVIDSIAQAVSVDELASDVEDWHRGLGARAWGKVLRRVGNHFDENENCVILVNQVRSNMQYGGGEDPTGGKAINYISSLSLNFRKSSWLYLDGDGYLSPDGKNKDTVNKDTEPHGMEFQVRVDKNTVATPHRSARMRLDFSTGEYDKWWDMTQLGIYFGVFEQTGSYYSHNGSKWQGKAKLREAIKSDEELQKIIVSTVLDRA